MTEKTRKAYSWDFDDTIIGREIPTKFFSGAKGKLSSPLRQPNDLEIQAVVHGVCDDPVTGLRERIALFAHSRRRVFPGVKSAMEQAKFKGVDHYGNTGRSNKKPWIAMSQATLERDQIADLIEATFYTPVGIRPSVSKAVALSKLAETYDDVSHWEDDPRTAILLASVLPNVTIYLVQYGLSGLLFSRRETKQFPNIRRVGFPQGFRE